MGDLASASSELPAVNVLLGEARSARDRAQEAVERLALPCRDQRSHRSRVRKPASPCRSRQRARVGEIHQPRNQINHILLSQP
jgi:hypothetical protein